MPGMYPRTLRSGRLCGGIAERRAMVDGRGTRIGDAVVGLESSGLHSNGFSLARAVFFGRCGLSVATA